MGVGAQLVAGTLPLVLCLALQVGILVLGVPLLSHVSGLCQKRFPKLQGAAILTVTLALILLGHTLQIWLWAVLFVMMNALPDISTALYFSLVTYTTVGYGDVTLGDPFRVFGAFASVTGLLAFGISTAFLIGVIVRVLPKTFDIG